MKNTSDNILTVTDEERIIEELEKRKEKIDKLKLKREIKHFRFTDFAQIIIGVGVFGLPAIINTSFWDYLPKINLGYMIYVHIFFLLCAVIAINYQFRTDLPFADKWFMIMFSKRIFYTYVSVMIAVFFMLSLVGQISFNMTMHDFLLKGIAAQNVGLMGAVTFSFFKKRE